MIFSYNEFDTALRIIGKYYDKVLLVDFEKDSYKLIKVNDSEYKFLKDKNMNFFDWINGFKNSKYSMNLNYNFVPEEIEKIEKPFTLSYKKVINGEMKDVTMEFVPIGFNRAYIFVKDYKAEVPKICSKEDCECCSQQCT